MDCEQCGWRIQMGSLPEVSVICSDHFKKHFYITKPDGKKSLSIDAEPTLFVNKDGSNGARNNTFSVVDKLSTDYKVNIEMVSASDHQSSMSLNNDRKTLLIKNVLDYY
ncbi:hypothetical protein Bhyg_12241, partial [Pseudolycoriella hygida]